MRFFRAKDVTWGRVRVENGAALPEGTVVGYRGTAESNQLPDRCVCVVPGHIPPELGQLRALIAFTAPRNRLTGKRGQTSGGHRLHRLIVQWVVVEGCSLGSLDFPR